MYRSVSWDRLSPVQQQWLRDLGVGPGDHLYITKFPPLAAAVLVARESELKSLGLDQSAIARTIAVEALRHTKTVLRHIKQIKRKRIEPLSDHATPSDSHLTDAA